MKKLLSFLLVVCMLLSTTVLFSSCAKVKAKDVEKDAQEVIGESLTNSLGEFFEDDADIAKIVEGALKSGAITISFESDKLGELKKVVETLYINEKDQKVVSETKVTYGDKTLSANIFIDKNGLIVKSKDVLGSDKSLAVNYATAPDKIANSALFGMIAGEAGVDVEMIKGYLTQIKDAMAKTEEATATLVNDILKSCAQTVETAKVANAAGKNVKCVVIGYTLNNDTLKAALEKSGAKDTLNGVLGEYAGADLDSLLDMFTINLAVKININQKNSEVVSITLDGSLTMMGQTVTVDGDVVFSDDQIKLTILAGEGEDKGGIEILVTKSAAKKVYTYKATVTEIDGNESEKVLEAGYTYNKKDDSLKIFMTSGEGENAETVEINGTLTSTKKEATIAITSIKNGETTTDGFKLAITFTKSADMPAAPTDAKDVLDLTEGELVDLVNEIQAGELAKLFGSAAE